MIWILYFILAILSMIVCWITNPIVCLFCNEEGELPEIFRMWQTWDDSCNPRFYILEHVPGFLRYDYDRHYEEYKGTTPELEAVGRTRWFAKVKDGNFSTKEKIQRYICRVMWLSRNCGYGFAFWCFGRMVDSNNIEYKFKKDGESLLYDKSKSILTRTWSYKNERNIFGNVYWNLYIGWKVDNGMGGKMQCMVAIRILAFEFR